MNLSNIPTNQHLPPNSDLAALEKSDEDGVAVVAFCGSVAGVVESACATTVTLSLAGVVVVLPGLAGVDCSALGSSTAVPPNLTWKKKVKIQKVQKRKI